MGYIGLYEIVGEVTEVKENEDLQALIGVWRWLGREIIDRKSRHRGEEKGDTCRSQRGMKTGQGAEA